MFVSSSIYILFGIVLASAKRHQKDANYYTFHKNNEGKTVSKDNTDWCVVEPAGMHTMCVFKKTDPNCKIEWRVLDDVGKKAVLDKHNELRNKHASGLEPPHPSSSNMLKLVWSDEVAEVAQRWADQCHTSGQYHDDNRNKLDGTYVGQNVEILGKYTEVEIDYYDDDYLDEDRVTNYIEITTEYHDILMEEMGEQCVGWYNEQSRFDAKKHANDSIEHYIFSHKTGHYTQMVWAESREVGCGWVLLENKDQKEVGFINYSSLLVCNYSPGGNHPGYRIYKEGPPASDCPSGFDADSEYPGLCSPPKDE